MHGAAGLELVTHLRKVLVEGDLYRLDVQNLRDRWCPFALKSPHAPTPRARNPEKDDRQDAGGDRAEEREHEQSRIPARSLCGEQAYDAISARDHGVRRVGTRRGEVMSRRCEGPVATATISGTRDMMSRTQRR